MRSDYNHDTTKGGDKRRLAVRRIAEAVQAVIEGEPEVLGTLAWAGLHLSDLRGRSITIRYRPEPGESL